MDEEPFRCLHCGGLAEIDAPGALTLGVKQRPIDATAPTCPCGARRWVRRHSMTEFYMYSRRADVCRIGDHIDARARPFHLLPRGPSGLVSIDVNVCPDHEAELRANGILGCFPIDDA